MNNNEFIVRGNIIHNNKTRRLTVLGQLQGNGVAKISAALCSEKDAFSKSRSEEIIKYRMSNLNKRRFYEVKAANMEQLKDETIMQFHQLVENPEEFFHTFPHDRRK